MKKSYLMSAVVGLTSCGDTKQATSVIDALAMQKNLNEEAEEINFPCQGQDFFSTSELVCANQDERYIRSSRADITNEIVSKLVIYN
jgi:hypothetical protein